MGFEDGKRTSLGYALTEWMSVGRRCARGVDDAGRESTIRVGMSSRAFPVDRLRFTARRPQNEASGFDDVPQGERWGSRCVSREVVWEMGLDSEQHLRSAICAPSRPLQDPAISAPVSPFLSPPLCSRVSPHSPCTRLCFSLRGVFELDPRSGRAGQVRSGSGRSRWAGP